MSEQTRPTLPGIDWPGYREYVDVGYVPWEMRGYHWLCPGCGGNTSVKRNVCDSCFRERVQKVVGFNRLNRPVVRWVMKLNKVQP